jgi:multiple sugar transport system substrate-binding protein
VASTWVWSLAISQFSQNPGAAWLFVQWATSRPALLLMNTKQWEGQPTYGPARSNWLFDQDEYQEKGLKDSWQNAHKKGIAAVPSNPPPVPIDTPQNMDIMSEAAIAMNSTVTGTKAAKASLDQAASNISEIVKEIPSAYLS